jgi:outer membrane protein assembly factor BamB
MNFRRPVRGAALVCAVVLAACGGGSGADPSSADGPAGVATGPVPGGDWLRFDFDAQRSGVGPATTGITSANVRTLRQRRVHLDGTVDSSPIELHAVRVRGRRRDVIVVTTTYGRTIAIDAGSGRRLWEFVPRDIGAYEGSAQITNTTPIADPNRRFVYAASPDGLIRKLVLANGHEVRSGHWPARVTLDATHEKLASALNMTGNSVVATTGGYVGDAPPYQGHVVMIDRNTGRITHVWNSLCANRHRLITPSTCPASDSAIWARAGAVIEPGTGRILVATGNAPFNGSTNWGDSVLELAPDGSRLLQNWTPHNETQLNSSDTDLGSTAPAILPTTSGRRLAVQGGKAGVLDLLDLDRLNGSGGASARTGGQLQELPAPGSGQVFTAPAVWTQGGKTLVFVADGSGTAAYQLHGGARPRLSVAAQNSTPGNSPVLAGGLLYVYDPVGGTVNVYEPTHLRHVASLPAATGHWNSPIVVGGRVILPEGNANDHARSGTLDIFHLPGR